MVNVFVNYGRFTAEDAEEAQFLGFEMHLYPLEGFGGGMTN